MERGKGRNRCLGGGLCPECVGEIGRADDWVREEIGRSSLSFLKLTKKEGVYIGGGMSRNP